MTDEASAADWLLGLLRHALATLDLPVLARLIDAWRADDRARVERWSAWLAACRADARDARRGSPARARRWRARWWRSASRDAAAWDGRAHVTHAAMFALAAARVRDPDVGGAGRAMPSRGPRRSTSAAVRLVPLGQSAGQRLLAAAGDDDPRGRRRARCALPTTSWLGRARPGDRQRAARDALQPAVPLMIEKGLA